MDIVYNCLTAVQVALNVQCPHLSDKEGKKICQKLLDEGMEGEVSDFDVQHFCAANPMYCYYFRMPSKHAKTQEEATLKDKISHIVTTA